MKHFLTNKQIVLGVTGGIAAYKSADLVRRLREVGAEVRVVMTEGAKQFITPLTMQAVSGNSVHDDLFDLKAEAAMGHIELARWADVIVIAPATADFIGHLVNGEAQDLLSTICLATQSPIAILPAMNQAMWKNTLTQENIQSLKLKRFHVWGPAEGNQACGDVGPGRMLEPLEIVDRVSLLFSKNLLAGKKVVITAGPTREQIDPIRFISNASSGKMGYALCESFQEAGANVVLVSGPVNLKPPHRVKQIDVISTEDMLNTVMDEMKDCDIFVSVAAVCDFRPHKVSKQKISKNKSELNELKLERTTDILAKVAALPQKPFVIGFAAETENVIANAKEKLLRKKIDMIVANEAMRTINKDEIEVTVLWKNEQQNFSRMSKQKLARELVGLIAKHI